jgi:hypothetical protein
MLHLVVGMRKKAGKYKRAYTRNYNIVDELKQEGWDICYFSWYIFLDGSTGMINRE